MMDTIIDVAEVQDALDRAARDARHGPVDVRAGRFIHASAKAAPQVMDQTEDLSLSYSVLATRRSGQSG